MTSGRTWPRFAASLTIALAMAGGGRWRAAGAVAQSPGGGACAALEGLQLANGRITQAEDVRAGGFREPGAGRASDRLPAFCRVAATLTPSDDSAIRIEVWMPAANWNGKFLGVGNGAFTGAIRYASMAPALDRGYATASTDTGHEGGRASFALGHPEKVIDFGWRAVHEMTVSAKAIVAAYYGRGARYTYWDGCSAGGRQGLKEAQRFPEDYDGIVAGAPALDWTGRAARAVQVLQRLQPSEQARLLEPQRERLHAAVLGACDAADGVADGVVSDPERCRFDPAVLECRDGSRDGCLTPAQVATARLLYSTTTNPQTGRAIAGLLPGSELGWTDLGWSASARATGVDHFRYLVFDDPAWPIATFDIARDVARAESRDAGTINALDPDLSRFFERGGKLIQYHGWSDPQISPANSTQFFERVVGSSGRAANRSYRLFMAPGMAHCGGGDGPNGFDALAALEAWVERGAAPDRIVASKTENGRIVRTRPLCAYPQRAVYDGSGSTDESANFVCRLP